MKKRFLAILLLILTAITSVSCTKSEDKKLQIVATLFPQYDFAKHMVGDKAEVKLLLNSGVRIKTIKNQKNFGSNKIPIRSIATKALAWPIIPATV